MTTSNIVSGRRATVRSPGFLHDNGISEEQFGVISLSASGDTQVLQGVAGQKFRVMSFWFTSSTAASFQWKSGSNNITGPFALNAYGGVAIDNEAGVFETNDGENLILNSDTTTVAGGSLTYVIV